MITPHIPQNKQLYQKKFFCQLYKNDKSIIKWVKANCKKQKHCRDYENKSEDDLIKILRESKPKINLSKKKIKEIKKDFSELRYGFSKSKINGFRRSLYNIKNFKKVFLHQE